VQGTHHGSEAARGRRGRGQPEQIEERRGANGFFAAHGSFYLFKERVFVMRLQLGAGLCQFSKKRH
jgi:hypothetical protein